MINQKAPNFSAPALIDGQIVDNFSLDALLGEGLVMLFFYPKDFTYVCPTELLALEEQRPLFEARGVQIVGCSTDSVESHYAWVNTPISEGGIAGVRYPLLADYSKTIAANYGVLGGDWGYDEGDDTLFFEGEPIAYRATFLIDPRGVICYQSIHDLGLGRNIDELLRIVDMWKVTQEEGVVCPANWREGGRVMTPTFEGVRSYLKEKKSPGCSMGKCNASCGGCSKAGCKC